MTSPLVSLGLHRRIAAAAAVLVTLTLVLLPGRPAGAQTYGPQPLGISCSVGSSGSGLTLTCTVTGFAANSDVQITIFSAPTSLGAVRTNSTGTSTLNASLPTDLAPGQHRVEATGTAASGGTVTAATTVTIPGTVQGTSVTGAEDVLPRTGTHVGALVSAGSALVAVGGLLVATTRQRRQRLRATAAA